MKLLEVQQLSKISDHTILNNVNLSVKAGEIHAIIGDNGNGKSTFAKILSGILPKTSGSFFIDTREVSIDDIKTAQNYGIYLVSQEMQLFPSLSVLENIVLGNEKTLFGSGFIRPGKKKIENHCQNILDSFQLQLDLERPASSLSLGEKQLIQLIRMILCRPSLLILDEFSQSLTLKESRQVFDILLKLKSEHIAILLLTQSSYEVLDYCDRVSILSKGTIVETYQNDRSSPEDPSFVSHIKKLSNPFPYPKLAAPKGKPLLCVEHISAGILKDITLTLHEGEILGIAGLVGSGRSTLIQTISGQRKPVEGTIHFYPPYSTKGCMSIVPENSADESLFSDCSLPFNIVSSNFAKTRKHLFVSGKKTDTYARNYIDKLNLQTIDIDANVNHLSLGDKQKIIIARSLFNRSKIYIFDEVSKNLDSVSRLELYNIFNALILEGSSILLISSDFSELIGMCSRVLLLYKGMQVGNYSTDHLTLDTLYEELLSHY